MRKRTMLSTKDSGTAHAISKLKCMGTEGKIAPVGSSWPFIQFMQLSNSKLRPKISLQKGAWLGNICRSDDVEDEMHFFLDRQCMII